MRSIALQLLGTALTLVVAATPTLAQSRILQDDDPHMVRITPEQEDAVERGLAWLSAHQGANGSWRSDVGFKLNSSYRVDRRTQRGHVGVTVPRRHGVPRRSGNLPGRGQVRRRGREARFDFVLSCVQDDGYITYAGTRGCTATRWRRCSSPRSTA